MTKYIAYYRVSTQRQGQSGLGLEAQQASIVQFLHGAQPIECYTEVESGRNNDRPQLQMALERCKLMGAVLLIAKLDRLARNVHFISGLMESGVDFIAIDNPHANRFMLHIMASAAEYEAEMISQRTKAALQRAKERGVELGGYRGTTVSQDARIKAVSVRRKKVAERNVRIREIVGETEGSSLRSLARRLNDMGIPSPSGGIWHANTVRRCL